MTNKLDMHTIHRKWAKFNANHIYNRELSDEIHTKNGSTEGPVTHARAKGQGHKQSFST